MAGSQGTARPELDVVTIGRASVDLYGQQTGSRLEDVASFTKAVGGCPANIAIGTARLGLKSALVTRVGDEQMGRFVLEQMDREGVSTAGIVTDPERLTALVLLAVEDEGVSPMIFYRTDCADMALDEEDIDEALLASSSAVVVTGTHFSQPRTAAAQRKAIRIARAHGRKVVFDIDYRPNLWGLAGHAAGFERYVRSDRVSDSLKSVLPDCDLVVGTEEEILIASGADDLLDALRTIRALSQATIVLKRGAMGCIVYEGPIGERLEDGIVGQGFEVEVYNVLGAGDAFMAGFLRGWLGGEPLATAASWGNACGAFAVSRLLCAPEYPSWDELQLYLSQGSPHRALRMDEALAHVHWASTRRTAEMPLLMALACDHRAQFEAMADEAGAGHESIGRFKTLAVRAAARVAAGRPGYGVLIDDKHGRQALAEAARHGLSWIGRPVEQPGSRPLRFEAGEDLGSRLVEWPLHHTVKCLTLYHPDDPETLKQAQNQRLLQLFEASRRFGLELLLEIVAGKSGRVDDTTIARVLETLYGLGIKPDWWKLEPQTTGSAWNNIESVIARNDPWCRGVVLLGLEAPQAELEAAFAASAKASSVKGFAIGRSIFSDIATAWFAGRVEDEEAVSKMAGRFAALNRAWLASRGQSRADAAPGVMEG